MSTWFDVGRALLGSWPSQVNSWGEDAIEAYLAELQARGVAADAALVAIRACPAGQRFPPSAPELAALARTDAAAPTFSEAAALIFGPGGVMKARTGARKVFWEIGERDRLNEIAGWERVSEMHPLIGAFIEREGFSRLRDLNLEDEQYGAMRRAQLQKSWEAHCEAMRGRELAAVAQGRRGELGSFDPLTALRLQKPAEITNGGEGL